MAARRHRRRKVVPSSRSGLPRWQVLSLGAGVQSSTLLLMSALGELPPLDHAVFADTGWEPRAVYEWLDRIEPVARDAGIEVIRCSAGSLRDAAWKAVRERGFIGMPLHCRRKGTGRHAMLRRQCTREYKVAPVHEALRRRVMGLPWHAWAPSEPVIDLWLGISTDEAWRVRPSRVRWLEHRHPLVDRGMSRADCIEWLRGRGFDDPPKSSCVCCPYRTAASWADMARRAPDEFAEAVAFDEAIRYLRDDGTLFLDNSLRPLPVVVEDADGDPRAFGAECTGFCGL